MRKLIAYLLHRMATRIDNTEHIETVEVFDEYDICRCRVQFMGDEFHGMGATFEQLPDGWYIGEHNVGRPDPY